MTSSHEERTAPLLASTTVCRRLGVWSAFTPSVTTSHARRGDPVPAQTTSSPSFFLGEYPARLAPELSAEVSATDGEVEATAALPLPFQCTWRTVPEGALSTTRSPPRTRRPL